MEDVEHPGGALPSEDPMRYATGYHVPVLWKAVVEGLVTDRAGLYIDATVGGGGHSAALLEALAPGGNVIGIDQDVEALEAVRARFTEEASRGRFLAVHGNFGDLERLLSARNVNEAAGLLLDLGVSSHQIDTAARGFSYMEAGALDMRMNPHHGLSAHDIVNDWDVGALRQLLARYGEEPRASRIARAIVQARPIQTTAALAALVRSVVPPSEAVKSLSRVFQAIRIAVNDELEMLERVLPAGLNILRPGGRMAVISYHSLEDRRVKRFFRYGNMEGEPVRDFYGNLLTPWREITRKPIGAGDAELAANPRARSARLRIAERI